MSSIAGCSHPAGNEYFCPVEVAYTQAGQMASTKYQVDVICYKSMTKKLKACYQETR